MVTVMFNPFSPSTQASVIPILREAFPDWKEGIGIFDALDDIATMPWHNASDSDTLNFEYFGNHSGGKFVAPVVMHLYDEEDEEFVENYRTILALIIWSKFKEPWTRLWETNVVAYNPIHNYDVSETRNKIRSDGEETFSESSDSTTTTHGRGSTDSSFTYGFNDDTVQGEPTERYTSQESGTTGVSGSQSESRERASDSSEVETTRKSGNIGVTSAQQMITQERQLWLWNYFNQIYKDIDTVLTLSIYDPCRI